MSINLKIPSAPELNPRITVFGVGGAGGNAVNNMITSNLEGVEFVVANTDAQALAQSKAERRVQIGAALTEGLGAGSKPEIGAAAAEEAMAEIVDHLSGVHMAFITGGMGGGTGTGAAPVIARAARELGILTVGVVTKPFQFEGQGRMLTAESGIEELTKHVDTLIVIPNQNLFRVANEKTTFADAFSMADEVLHSGVAGITDLMVKEGLINLDFADVRAVMNEMGKAMMGTGQASGEKRAIEAAEAAISNPLLDDVSMRGARGLLISITGGDDLTLYEVDEAATRIREEVDLDANIILGATFDSSLDGYIRVSVVATGIDRQVFEEAANQPSGLNNFEPNTASTILPVAVPPALEDDFDDEQNGSFNVPEQKSVEASIAPMAPMDAGTIIAEENTQLHQETETVTHNDLFPGDPSSDNRSNEMSAGHNSALEVAPRMPKIDDFSPLAVKQYRENEAEVYSGQVPQSKKRPGFFKKLVNAGLGKRNNETGSAPTKGDPEFVRPATERHAVSPKITPQEPPRQPAVATAPQSAQVPRDDASFDSEQLEIPAFLRRQAN
jgi:cell division protein FtsZ